MLQHNAPHDDLKGVSSNTLQAMQTSAEHLLNPLRYHLSEEAKKRLRWLYLTYYEQGGNVTKAASKLGISRPWLSTLKATFERHRKDPRSLEPHSRAPHHTENRNRIPSRTERLILNVRDGSPGWGKDKLARILARDHQTKIHPSTVNRYLHKHRRINPQISDKNRKAWQQKFRPILKVKFRPPRILKDYAPGALVEKDMKYVRKSGAFILPGKTAAKEHFHYQHTMIDSFTRLRVLELVPSSDSATASAAYERSKNRFPFPIALTNTDNGGENEKTFSETLSQENVFQCYSSVGTPTDNPRVERSHKSDDDEFYGKGNSFLPYEEQRTRLLRWEHRYNYERPHQALGYLTPIEFYHLWKCDPHAAHALTAQWQRYLAQQRKRLAHARRIKRHDQIEALMQFIDAKLHHPDQLLEAKKQLINCQLCSWT